MRKARTVHINGNLGDKQRGKGAKKKKGKAGGCKTNGQAPPDGTSVNAGGTDAVAFDGPDGETIMLHPSVLPDAPEPIEPQCLFLRAAAYLQHAVFLIEDAIFKLEGIQKIPSIALRLSNRGLPPNGRAGWSGRSSHSLSNCPSLNRSIIPSSTLPANSSRFWDRF